jgi:hypothetical protein
MYYFGNSLYKSPNGTIIKIYSYVHPNFKQHPLQVDGHSQFVSKISFIYLHRMDKIYFPKPGQDFTIYDIDQLDWFVNNLLKNDFKEIDTLSIEDFENIKKCLKDNVWYQAFLSLGF